jgi:hypothetical protein
MEQANFESHQRLSKINARLPGVEKRLILEMSKRPSETRLLIEILGAAFSKEICQE